MAATKYLAALKKEGNTNFPFATMLQSLPCCKTICKDRNQKLIKINVRGYASFYSVYTFMPAFLSEELLFLTRWPVFRGLSRLSTLDNNREFNVRNKLIFLQRMVNLRLELFESFLELNRLGYKSSESDCASISSSVLALDTKTAGAILGMTYVYKRRAHNQRVNNLYIQGFDGRYLNFNLWIRRK